MNDPHVERLWYEVLHGQHVDFDNAPPLDWETGEFRLHLEGGTARFDMIAHFATEREAKCVVDPFVRAWELQADLENPEACFRLRFQRPEIVDRNPADLRVYPAGISMTVHVGMNAVAHVKKSEYFKPAPTLCVNEVVDRMWQRYRRYSDGATELPSAVNYCLTELGNLPGGRRSAGEVLRISPKVLTKMSELAAIKGGAEARKAVGAAEEYSPQEREWLEASLKILIRRSAEHAAGNVAELGQITMSDLPSLEGNPL